MIDPAANLMASYIGLVRALAWRIHQQLPRSVELDDLVGYGCIGLAEAARGYDPRRGHKFSTFAYYRIRGAIFDGLSQMAWFRRDKYEARGYQPSELDGESVPQGEVEMAFSANSAWFRASAERLAGSHGSTGPARAHESVDRSVSAESAVMQQEVDVRLRQLVEALPPAAAELLKATYYEGLTLKDAAIRQGRNKSWASRLHARVLRQLALSLKAEGFA
jgi:RNA polymerase sigma factor for flagellar operon FliA